MGEEAHLETVKDNSTKLLVVSTILTMLYDDIMKYRYWNILWTMDIHY